MSASKDATASGLATPAAAPEPQDSLIVITPEQRARARKNLEEMLARATAFIAGVRGSRDHNELAGVSVRYLQRAVPSATTLTTFLHHAKLDVLMAGEKAIPGVTRLLKEELRAQRAAVVPANSNTLHSPPPTPDEIKRNADLMAKMNRGVDCLNAIERARGWKSLKGVAEEFGIDLPVMPATQLSYAKALLREGVKEKYRVSR